MKGGTRAWAMLALALGPKCVACVWAYAAVGAGVAGQEICAAVGRGGVLGFLGHDAWIYGGAIAVVTWGVGERLMRRMQGRKAKRLA